MLGMKELSIIAELDEAFLDVGDLVKGCEPWYIKLLFTETFDVYNNLNKLPPTFHTRMEENLETIDWRAIIVHYESK